MTFEEATGLERVSAGVFAGVVPDHWQQGKGAFGGVVIGLLARAMTNLESERRLRSLSADLGGPAMPGPVRVESSVFRRGGSMSFLEARLLQDDAVIARASASFATPRAVPPAAFTPSSVEIPRWQDIPVSPVGPPIAPVFAEHYEYRSTGPVPFTGGLDPSTAGFVRPKALPEVYDVPAVCALLDTWWPTVFSVSTMPRAVATVAYTMQLLTDPRMIHVSEPVYFAARGVEQADNFFVEMRELWSGGRRVAMNQQTFALLT